MPRTAAEQLEFGRPVARSELQAGDLLFMHLSSKELHVAFALTGSSCASHLERRARSRRLAAGAALCEGVHRSEARSIIHVPPLRTCP